MAEKKETANGKRLLFADYMKAFGIILVVLGHINFANSAVKPWIYAFHMPLFFFVTGLLQKENLQLPDGMKKGNILWRNLWRLIIPFVLWGLIYMSFEWQNLLNLLYGSHQTIGGAGSLSSLWFLPVMFLAVCLFSFLSSLFKEKNAVVKKTVAAVICFGIAAFLPTIQRGYPWGADVAVCALGFMLLGSIIKPLAFRIRERIKNMGMMVFVVCGLAAVFFAGTFLYRNNIPESGYINMAVAKYGRYPVFVAEAIIGIFFIMLISILLERISGKESIFQKCFSGIGKATLCIMMTHKPIIDIFKLLFTKVKVPNGISMTVTCFATVAAGYLLFRILEQYLPVLVGKYIPLSNKKDQR